MFSLPGYIGLHWFVIFQKDGLCFGGINFNIDIILFCLFFLKSWIIFEWDIAYQCSSDFAYLYLSDIAFRYGYLLVYIYFIQVLDWCHQLYCQPTHVSTERGRGGSGSPFERVYSLLHVPSSDLLSRDPFPLRSSTWSTWWISERGRGNY